MKNPIDLAAEAAAFADQYQMLPQGSTVLCAVSGGKDSMALLSVLQTLAPERNLMIHAAHFNHQLRGEESQRDENFVSKWCADHNIPLTIGSGDVAQAAQEQGKGIEETARAMRYGFLTETAQEVGAEKIATAHNADDNAETVLLHLVRGSGLDGLTGIPPVRGILIRPLLGVPRIDIEVYLAQENIPHVEDSSNQDTKFARNRIRQAILPVMKDLNPAFVSTLSANLVHLREDRELLAFFRSLGRLRKIHPELRRGDICFLEAGDKHLAYERQWKTRKCRIYVNRSGDDWTVTPGKLCMGMYLKIASRDQLILGPHGFCMVEV